jgi:recombination protein RecT
MAGKAEMVPTSAQPTGLMKLVSGPTFQSMMRESLPAVGLNPARLTGIVATELRKIPKLQQCEPASFYRSVMQCAELGLVPGGAQGFCWIIPYGKEATFVLGYKGAVHLCWRTQMISSVDAHAVYEGDNFDYEYGTKSFIKHKPPMSGTRDGAITHFWAELWPKGADRSMFSVMTFDECMAWRAQYVRNKKGPWFEAPTTSAFQWMCKKTVLKQLLKLAPTSAEMGSALHADSEGEQGMPPTIDVMPDEVAALEAEVAGEGEELCGGPCIRAKGHTGDHLDEDGNVIEG